MPSIAATWSRLRAAHQKALVPFFTAGYPRRQTTLGAIRAAVESGADMIELGVPFSDPLADGPAIQESSQVALRGGMDLPGVLRLVEDARRFTDIPLLLMGYYNPFFRYGLAAFARDAKQAGVDGLIVPDLPPEEAANLRREAARRGLSLVFLIAPTTTDERIRRIAAASTDFCYCVSVTGVTGARARFARHTETYLRRVKRLVARPIVVGFGASQPRHVRRLGRYADGVVVGSALVPLLAAAGARSGSWSSLRRALGALVEAAHGRRS